jgi:hypothetical protein
MYSLIIGYVGPKDPDNEIIVAASRFLEYSDSETQMRYRTLTPEMVREIKSFPVLLMHENYEDGAFVADIINITGHGRDYKLTFKRDGKIGIIAPQDIERLALELGINDDFEFCRTHWAIKNSDLHRVLSDNRVKPFTDEQEFITQNKPAVAGSAFNNEQIFIVHDHDEHAKNDVKRPQHNSNLIVKNLIT